MWGYQSLSKKDIYTKLNSRRLSNLISLWKPKNSTIAQCIWNFICGCLLWSQKMLGFASHTLEIPDNFQVDQCKIWRMSLQSKYWKPMKYPLEWNCAVPATIHKSKGIVSIALVQKAMFDQNFILASISVGLWIWTHYIEVLRYKLRLQLFVLLAGLLQWISLMSNGGVDQEQLGSDWNFASFFPWNLIVIMTRINVWTMVPIIMPAQMPLIPKFRHHPKTIPRGIPTM